MPYMNIILIVLAVVLIVGLVVMTISLKKLILRQKPDEVPDKYIEVQKNDDHIRDFFDINTKKETKVSSFKEEYEEEERTTGLDFESYYKKTSSQNETKEEKQSAPSFKNDYDDEFKTVSFENNYYREDEPAAEAFSAAEEPKNDDTLSIDNEAEAENDETQTMEDDTQAMEPEPARPNVVLTYRDRDRSRIIKMTTDQVTVGRSVGSDLLLGKDSFCSRNHAIFTFREGRLCLKDLNSKNGTFVDGERVDGEVVIEKNCQVAFGNAVVQVQID